MDRRSFLSTLAALPVLKIDQGIVADAVPVPVSLSQPLPTHAPVLAYGDSYAERISIVVDQWGRRTFYVDNREVSEAEFIAARDGFYAGPPVS